MSHKIDFTTQSTTEHIVGTDINGKSIYERTISGTYSGSQGRTTVNFPGFTAGEVEKIIQSDGYIEAQTAGYINKIPTNTTWYDNAGNMISFSVVTIFGNIPSFLIYNTASASNLSYYVTIKYTKSS